MQKENKSKIIAASLAAGMAAGAAVWQVLRHRRLSESVKKPIVLPKGFTITAQTGALNTVHNTPASIQRCLDFYSAAGIPPVLEVDVHFAADGTPVLSRGAAKNSENVFTLAEAMEMVRGYGTNLYLNLKDISNLREIQNLAQDYGMLGRVYFTRIPRRFAPLVKRAAPKVPYYIYDVPSPLLANNKAYLNSFAKELKNSGALGLNTAWRSANKQLIDAMHQNGLRVSLWPVNDAASIHTALTLGADNITSRHPDLLLKVLISRLLTQVQNISQN